MPSWEHNSPLHRELKITPDLSDYEVLDPVDGLMYTYMTEATPLPSGLHDHYTFGFGENFGAFKIEGARSPEKGKYLLLVIEASYEASSPNLEICSSTHHFRKERHIFCSHVTKGAYKRAVETLRSGDFTAYHEQQQLLFQPIPVNSPSELTEAEQDQFHDLIDKKLMGTISVEERQELEKLEDRATLLEAQDPEERVLRDEWSTKLEGAITTLRDINRKLELLIASGK